MGAAVDQPGPDQPAHIAAHGHSVRNEAEVLASRLCGCFHCLRIFPPTELGEDDWTDEDGAIRTALCPYCGIDAVIGSGSGQEVTQDLLTAMHTYWLG